MDASFGMTGRRLRAADAQCNASLRQLGKAARDDEPASAPPSIVIPRGSDRRPLLAQVMPVRGLGLDMLPGTRLALLVTDLGRDSIADPDDLRALFQLSSSEAEVATLIARGFTVREMHNAVFFSHRSISRFSDRFCLKCGMREPANKKADRELSAFGCWWRSGDS